MNSIKIGLIGLGTVGQGVLEILAEQRLMLRDKLQIALQIEHVVDRSFAKKTHLLKGIPASNNIQDILENDEIDLVVETMGGLDPAYAWLKSALSKKKSVVTANKFLMAEKGLELFELARANKNSLYCEAAIAGAIPVVQNIQENLLINDIKSIYAILNASSNFILSLMARQKAGIGSVTYQEALNIAGDLGYTEADPSLDVEGYDAAQKLALLVNLAFSTQVKIEDDWITGIEDIRPVHFQMARSLDMRIVPLAVAHNDTRQIYVAPTLISKNHLLSSIQNQMNAIMLDTNQSGLLVFIGSGAGKRPTAASVISDMINYTMKKDNFMSLFFKNKTPFNRNQESLHKFYIHLQTREKVGLLSELTHILAENGISLASLHQDESREPIEIAIITHKINIRKLNKAKKELETSRIAQDLYGKIIIFRIEDSFIDNPLLLDNT